MSAPLYTTLIPDFFNQVLQPVLNTYVYNGYSALAEHLRLPLGVAVVLSLSLLGIGMSQGWIQVSMDVFVKWATKVGLIYVFAMNWGVFSHFAVKGIQDSAGQMAGWLVSATPLSLPQFAGSGIEGALQSVLIEVADVGGWVWQAGGFSHPSPWVSAICIWVFGFTMLVLGMFELVLAQLMLAILFTLAPLFIACTLFKPTQGFFDRWLGMLAGYAFLFIFMSAALALALNFSQWVLGNLYLTHATGIHLIDFIPTLFVCCMGIGIILKVTHLAHHIGASLSIGSGTAMVASSIGGAISTGRAGIKWIGRR